MSDPAPRLAEPRRDNAALCDLARRCPQGRHFRFFHQRDDYWQRCRLHRESQVLVIDRAEVPVASATFARKAVWLDGAFRSAVYIFDVMVDPALRGQGLARRLLDSVFQRNPDAWLFYCYILADNQGSRSLFEKAGFRSCPHLLLYHPVLPTLEGRRPSRRLRQSCSGEEIATIDALLRRQWDFLDTTAGHDAVFTLEQGGAQAWAALRKHEPQVFVDLPCYAALVGRVLPIVPAPGQRVTVWSLHHMGWKETPHPRPLSRQGRGELIPPSPLAGEGPGVRGPRTLRRLIRSVAWLASRSRINALVLPLFENDPLTAVVRPLTLTRWGISPSRVHLYATGPVAPLLLQSPRPLVLSGQDG